MKKSDLHSRSFLIKKFAVEQGFDHCGISIAGKLGEEASRLAAWLEQGRHGAMHYMARHFDKRLDPSNLVQGAKSVISLMHNYYPKKELFRNDRYRIARYAYGEDYHFVIRRKLRRLLEKIRSEFGNVEGRAFVDSAPVMERQWAAKAGLGWIGKNTLLLNRKMGSYFFLAELIIDLELQPDSPIRDYCGSCTKCLDACPTQALSPYAMDAGKCISYLTIELKDKIPEQFRNSYDHWIFGCDICQEVCPWNRFSIPHQEPALDPDPFLEQMTEKSWEDITPAVFKRRFRKSAFRRTGFRGIKRNMEFLRKTS
jgi:epoxyqueuosine reductase